MMVLPRRWPRMCSGAFISVFLLALSGSTAAASVVEAAMSNDVGDSNGTTLLFDFTSLPREAFDLWEEQSDIVRSVGMSKAVLAQQKTQIFQRAVFFTMLNPQPNGAGFAGVRRFTSLNLSSCHKLLIRCRGQGENLGYKIVLRHKGQNDEPYPTYEKMFQAPSEAFAVVELRLEDFEPYYRGRRVEAIALDTADITNFGFQVYGGVYMSRKQKGASSLEIDWVKAE